MFDTVSKINAPVDFWAVSPAEAHESAGVDYVWGQLMHAASGAALIVSCLDAKPVANEGQTIRALLEPYEEGRTG